MFATEPSDLAHELQKERGTTGMFAGNWGQTFASEVRMRYRAAEVPPDRARQHIGTLDGGRSGEPRLARNRPHDA